MNDNCFVAVRDGTIQAPEVSMSLVRSIMIPHCITA